MNWSSTKRVWHMFNTRLNEVSIHKTLLASSFVLLAANRAACDKKPAVLTEKSLHKFYDAGLDAVGKRDAKGVCGQFAKTAEVKRIKFTQSGSDKVTHSKAEYCQLLEESFAQMNAMQASTNMNVSITDMSISGDGKSADVSSKVSEVMTVMGTSAAMDSEQTAHIELFAGEPMITKAVILMKGAS